MSFDLEAVEARCAAASPGPWEPVLFNEGLWNECMGISGTNPYGHNRIETLAQNQWFSHGPEDEDRATESCYANIRLMAHARTDLPAAIEEIKKLRAEVDRAWDEARELREKL